VKPPPLASACLLTAPAPQVAVTQLEAWRDVVPDVRSVELFTGGHFFLIDERAAVTSSVARKLGEFLDPRPRSE
jgi:surfactin synthase thioesterase subunit